MHPHPTHAVPVGDSHERRNLTADTAHKAMLYLCNHARNRCLLDAERHNQLLITVSHHCCNDKMRCMFSNVMMSVLYQRLSITLGTNDQLSAADYDECT